MKIFAFLKKHLLLTCVIIILVISLIFTLPQWIGVLKPRREIDSMYFPTDIDLKLTIDPRIGSLDTPSFTAQCEFQMLIEENSSMTTDYNLLIKPAGFEDGNYGVGVPFSNLNKEGPSYGMSNGKWTTYNKYTHSASFAFPIINKVIWRFPGDYYESASIFVWFDGAYYPRIILSKTYSIPNGYTIILTAPHLVNNTYFYNNVIEPFDRLFVAKPSFNVLEFHIAS